MADKKKNNLSPHRHPALFPAGVAAVYIGISVAWILWSDHWLLAWIREPESLTYWQNLKGLFFVGFTGALLYLTLLRHNLRQARQRQEIKQQELLFRSLAQGIPDIVTVLDPDNRIVYQNEAGETVLGFSHGQLLQVKGLSLVHPEDVPLAQRILQDAFSHPEKFQEATLRIRHKDGAWHSLRIKGRGLPDIPQGPLAIFSGQDETERIRQEQHIRMLSRLYATLSGVNSAVIHATSGLALYEAICRVAVDAGEMPLAWVGVVDRQSHAVVPVAKAGAEIGCLEGIQISIDDIPAGRGPAGTAVREKRLRFINDVATDSSMEPWRDRLLQRDFRSCAALPLLQGNEVVAVFCLYSREPGFFDSQQVRLLEELAADISYCQDAIAKEAQRRQAEQELRKLSRAVEQGASGVFILDSRGRVEYVNPKFTQITGYTAEQCLGRGYRFLLPKAFDKALRRDIWHNLRAGKEWHGELTALRKEGTAYWSVLTFAPIRDEAEAITHYVGLVEDITELKETQSHLQHLTYYDPLTGLPNRAHFLDRTAQALASAQRSGSSAAVLFLDLDRFKNINDTLGYSAGNRLLQEAAGRLTANLRQEDTVARLTGDEFAVLLPRIGDPETPAETADRLLAVLASPFAIADTPIYVSASIGIALFPADATDPDTLIQRADTALHEAKIQGGRFHFFTPELNLRISRKLELEQALKRGLERREFLVHYQPQVKLQTGQVTGVEALVRWNRGGPELVPPAEFIPVAEETGLIEALGAFVLEQACADAKIWHSQHHLPLRVAVNLSGRQFQKDLLARISGILDRTQLDPRYLELELTDSILMGDAGDILSLLNSLKWLGITLSIDDFGTGYSSLSYLKRFPIDKLKIDQSFVHNMADDADARIITAAIIGMGHTLRLTVIAEGVEGEAQRRLLLEHGCDEAQGYYFARPMPAEAIPAFVTRHSP